MDTLASHAYSSQLFLKLMENQALELFNARSNLLTKLQRTVTAQIEALSKLKRGGAQTVEVKHVHVHEGGQAVVGAVNHGGVGQSDGTAGRAHARTVSDAEMRSEDAVLSTVPVARREGKARCRMHGGARGSGGPKGQKNGRYRTGFFTCEAIEERILRRLLEDSREIPLINGGKLPSVNDPENTSSVLWTTSIRNCRSPKRERLAV